MLGKVDHFHHVFKLLKSDVNIVEMSLKSSHFDHILKRRNLAISHSRVVELTKDSTELEKPDDNTTEKMREGVVELTKFTRNVLAGLASPLLALEGIDGMLSKTSAVQGKRTLKMMETELRNLNEEASELYMIATTMLHDPRSVDWKST
ncbi:hypothetical protein BDQ17DRAFT_1425665 [Cyathus striatus]|nr:hypothetical protein BDQ17DRAFT_1425665 [Cyathus striatus]